MNSNEAHDDSAEPRAGGAPGRRPYARPELNVYGPLAKLTRGSASGATEATPQGKKAMK